MAIVLPHVFQDGVNETASGVQLNENFNVLKAAIEAIEAVEAALAAWPRVTEGSHSLKIQTGVFVVPGFGGGPWSFGITMPKAWPTAHVAFIAGVATSPTANMAWLSGGQVEDLTKGRVRGPSGPNFEGASVPWVSIGY